MHLLLILDKARQVGKVVQRQASESDSTLAPEVKSSHMKVELPICYTCVGGQGLSHACFSGGGSVSMSHYGSRLVDSGSFLMVSLTLLAFSIGLSYLPQDS